MTTHVLYHAECPDGFAAAFVAFLAFKALPSSLLKFHPVAYGQPLPPQIQVGDEVYIVDFSYPRQVLVDLAARVATLVVLDHHQTAREALDGLPFARFDMDKSGAVLAWEHWFPGTPVPDMLLYIQDRDLWQWRLPQSKEVNAGLWRVLERSFGNWRSVLNDWPAQKPKLTLAGAAVLSSDMGMVETLCAQSRLCPFEDEPVPAVNTAVLQSEVGHELLKRFPNAPFAVCWSMEVDGLIRVSLRSRTGGFNVADLAKMFGGGGHAAAAGFRVEAPAMPTFVF